MSVLKAFLTHHDIETTVIYWNLLLDRLLPPFERDSDAIHFDLLPYLYLMADAYQDEVKKSKANAMIKAQLPWHDIMNHNSDYLVRTRELLDATVDRTLAPYVHGGPLLFGISCKFEQWISGVVLANSIKARLPQAKIVIGGLRSRDKAEAIMTVCSDFDFAVWGEGEYPLLSLCRAIQNDSEDLSAVPRLVFRQDGSLQPSATDVSRYHDLNSRIFPDYDDYFRCLENSGSKSTPAIFPLESSRGCTWNACHFCVYADGYKTRKKEAGVLTDEIRFLVEKYGARYFAFMDNDIVADDHLRLNRLLDDLISLNQEHPLHFIAEVIAKHFTAATLKKLSQAGFHRIHFGYESLSDRLLTKMHKRTNFSDNVFFVKFAHHYKIKLPSANIISGIIGEQDLDILECIDNLHFLRFYFDRHLFVHTLIPLRVAKHSVFYNMIAAQALPIWNDNIVFDLLPGDMVAGVDRFSLFDFAARPNLLWDAFSRINEFYYDHDYSYHLSLEEHRVIYREYFDGDLLITRSLDELELRLLQAANSVILDLDDLMETLAPVMPAPLDAEAVCEALDRLKDRHLLYFDDGYRSIISVIHADQIEGVSAAGTEFT
jgi:radical SAM superfamily enzyme YgiQ (UPF0313 family)